MSGFAVRGWCPGALRPMLSGDGLVVRVRPRLGRLTPIQASGIARAARAHGSGVIDLTSRANLQIRGVRDDAHPRMIADLDALGLVDATEALEARRNIIVTPLADAAILEVARIVESALPGMPALPGKFGFAVDCGTQRVLADVSADIRVERCGTGDLMLRADGMDLGWRCDAKTLARDLAGLVLAYLAASHVSGRMADVVASDALAMPPADAVPVARANPPVPGFRTEGALVGFAFGQTDAETLAALADLGPIRLTPWRMVLVEGVTRMPDLPGLITDPADSLRGVVACTGAPGCPQGLAPTRQVARTLAPHVPSGRTLHVSGCAKGCAHPGRAGLTLVASAAGFHAIRNGTARDTSTLILDDLAQTPNQIASLF
jgi:precorrin-3B synthase